jgi:NADH-quinone oxidoreductase subunit G
LGVQLLGGIAAELGAEGFEPAPGQLGAEAGRIAGVVRPGSTVIVCSEEARRASADALVACARAARGKLLEVPSGANGRGLREVGCLPGVAPGLAGASPGMAAEEIREALDARELEALLLVEVDPVRDLPGGPLWKETLNHAHFVLAVSAFQNGSTAHADVVFPAEGYAEKEGTVTHPDGRLQRLRPAVPRPGDVRATWQVLVELAALLDHETSLDSAPEVLGAIASEVPFYAGLTHEEIGGRGVRWQEREAATRFSEGPGIAPSDADSARSGPEARADGVVAKASAGATPGPSSNGIRLGTYRDLWAAEVTQRSPALRFLFPKQTLEVAPADSERLGIASGDDVDVRSNGTTVRARVALRERVRPGSGFLIDGLGDGATSLDGELVEITKAGEDE